MLKKFWNWLYWGKNASPYASFERRIIASMIDTLLLSIAVTPLLNRFLHVAEPARQTIQNFFLLYQEGAINEEMLNQKIISYLLFEGGGKLLLADLAYQLLILGVIIVLFWLCRSATPGKMLLNMEIVDARTGGKPRPWQWIVRYAGYVVAVAPLMLGFLWILWDKKRQGWHDKLARTVVVIKPRREKES